MSDYTPGLPVRKTLVLVDNNGNRFSTDITVNPGLPGADGDPSGCLPLTGGTLTGQLTVNDLSNNDTKALLTPASGHNAYYQVQDADGIHMVGKTTGNSSELSFVTCRPDFGGFLRWAMNRDTACLTSPSSHPYLEVVNPRAVKVQHFSVTARNGDFVAFPEQFTGDAVKVLAGSYFDGSNFVVCGATRQHAIDRNGFTLSKWNAGPSTGWNGTADVVDIVAIGPA